MFQYPLCDILLMDVHRYRRTMALVVQTMICGNLPYGHNTHPASPITHALIGEPCLFMPRPMSNHMREKMWAQIMWPKGHQRGHNQFLPGRTGIKPQIFVNLRTSLSKFRKSQQKFHSCKWTNWLSIVQPTQNSGFILHFLSPKHSTTICAFRKAYLRKSAMLNHNKFKT